MKWSLIFILLFVSTTFAQTIIPPFGFKDLHVNMTTAELVEEMGQPKKIVSFEDEKKVWVDGGFPLEKAIVFHIGFQEVYVYDYQNKYCLWKAYIKDDQVIYMNLVSRYVWDQYKSKVSILGKLYFQDPTEKFEQVLGKNFFPDRDFGYTDYLYHDLGIRFTFKQDKMTNIYLFRRLSNRADLLKLIKYYD